MLRLVAWTAGGLLNITRLAQDASVSSKTAREWLSILESSYIIFLLPPYFANIRKRLVKNSQEACQDPKAVSQRYRSALPSLGYTLFRAAA